MLILALQKLFEFLKMGNPIVEQTTPKKATREELARSFDDGYEVGRRSFISETIHLRTPQTPTPTQRAISENTMRWSNE